MALNIARLELTKHGLLSKIAAMNFEAIELAFQRAAIDPSQWDDAMAVAARETGSWGAVLLPVFGERLPVFPTSASLAETVDTYVKEGWIHRDERYRAGPRVKKVGVATDIDVFSEEEMKRGAFHQEFLARFGLRWWGAVKVDVGDEPWVLSIQRSAKQEAFSMSDQRSLARLSQRLSGAGMLARTLGFARVEAALDAFEASKTPALMLDRNGEVFRMNPSAETLLTDDPRIFRRRLTSHDHRATAALDRALHALLWSGPPVAISMPSIPLPRRGRNPILAYPIRLEGVSRDALAPCRAVVLLRDLEQGATPSEAAVRSVFGLTAAEARLTTLLVNGHTLADAADHLNIARDTARNQLKAIFSKTGVNRQTALVSLVSRLIE